MSKTIDERVVEMRFDNAQFERNVSTSMSTLEKLKQSLQLSGVTNSIEQVGQKFSAFETMAVGALLRIGSQAVDTAEKLVKSLSIDQITAGWSKYGDKTSAVQTIMAATAKDFEDTGEQMEYVNGELEKLNWFTDETSYSFLDMVSNIGKFTSNNIALDKSVSAMQGISTWAAISGANAGEASRAMYNLSQAISVGAVKLMDWKSIENANMATAEFKQTAIDTAVATGTLVDKGNGLYETMKGNEVSVTNFNSALSDAWFTSDVLLTTLDKYGGFSVTLSDISSKTNLTATQLLGYLDDYKAGNLDMAKVLEEVKSAGGDVSLTVDDLSESFAQLADETNELGERAFRAAQEAKTFEEVISSVKDAVSTGWMTTFETIFGNYTEAKEFWTQMANELYDVFAEGGNLRNQILAEWKELGGRDDLIQAFWNIFHAITGIISAVKGAFDDIFNPIFSDAENGASRLQILTARLKAFTERLKITDDETGELNETGQKIKSTFRGVFAALGIVKDVIVALIKPIKELFTGVGSGALDFSSNMGEMLVNLRETIKQSGVLEKITERLSGVFKALNEFIGNTVELFRGVSYWEGGGGIAGIFESMFDGVNNVIRLFFNAISALTGKDLSGVRDKIITTLQKIRDKVVDACGPLSDIFEKVKTGISKAFESIKKVFGKFGKIDTGGISTLSEKTDKAFKPITALLEGVKKIFSAVWELLKKLAPVFSAVFTALGNFLGRIGEGVANVIKNADFSKLLDMVKGGLEVGIGVQIFQFIKSLKDGVKGAGGILSSVKKTFEGIKTCITGLSDCIKAYEKNINAKTLLTIAGAIGILALSMLVLSSIDGAKLDAAIVAVTLLFAELVVSFALLNKMGDTKKIKKVGTTMIELAAAVLVLAIALKAVASLNAKQLTIGLVGITVLLAEVVVAAKVLGNDKDSGKMMKGAANAIAFALAIKILASSLKSIGSMSWEELAKGIVGITVLMIEMVAAAKIIGNDKDSKRMLKGATNAVIFGAAMAILAGVLKKMASLSWQELAKGLVGLTAILAEMVIAVKIVGNDKDSKRMLKGATNMVIFAAAIAIFAANVKSLAKLGWKDLAKGLVGITVIMAEMVAAAKLMNGSGGGATAMLAASAAMLVLSISLKALGKLSWEQIAKGLVAIAAAFTIIGVAGYLLEPLVPAILALSAALALMGVGAVLFGSGLLLVSAALTAFAGSAEIIVDSIIQIIIRLVTAIPDILGELAKSLNASLDSIIEMLVTVAKAALMALYEVVPLAVEVVLDLILSTLRSIADNIQPIIEALLDIVVGVINGLASGIPKIISATVELFKAIFDALFDALGGFDLGAIAEAIAAVAMLDVLMAGIAIMTVTATVAVAPLPLIAKSLNDFIVAARPFLDEIQTIDPASLQGAKALAEMILILTANGILEGLTSWFTGGTSIVEFGQQLAEFAPYLRDYYTGIMGIDGGIIEASANAALALATMATNLPNSGGLAAVFAGDNTLSQFAKELSAFAPSLVDYANSVAGLDGEVIVNSANAATALSELANNLPNSGGIAAVFAGDNTLSSFAKELSAFGPALKSYADSVIGLDTGVVTNSANAAMALAELADNLPNSGGVVSWFAGDNSLADFAEELKAFGPSFKDYAEQIKGIDSETVTASANAALALAELANKLPNSGGVASWFEGDNSLSDFAEELEEFGPKLKSYADSIKGIDGGLVVNSANAALALAELANKLPNSGGVASWFEGDNSLADFAEELKKFGPELKAYADSVAGLDGDVIVNSTNAAMAIAKFASNIPNSGGIVADFAGDNTLSGFAKELKAFGPELMDYAESVSGLDGDVVVNSANAAMALAELANNLPNSGGIVAVFSGDNTLSSFAKELTAFGPALMEYAASVEGIDAQLVTDSATAAMALAELANNLPSTGGIKSIWSGDSSLSGFAEELKAFGPAFHDYSDSISGIDPEVVIASANAATSLANLANNLPSSGGISSWLSGEQSLADFAEELKKFGPGFSSYAASIDNVNPDKVSASGRAASDLADALVTVEDADFSELTAFGKELNNFGPAITQYSNSVKNLDSNVVDNSARCAKVLFEMAQNLPNRGGILEWFTGEQSLTTFAQELDDFGPALMQYAISVSGLDSSVVENSASCAKVLFEMAQYLPAKGGIVQWFSGEQSLTTFAEELSSFGPSMKAYYENVKEIEPDVVDVSTNSAKALAELAANLPATGGLVSWFGGDSDLASFGESLVSFGASFSQYSSYMETVKPDILETTTNAAHSILELQNSLPESGGLFSNNATLSRFGMDMEGFGNCLKGYYDAIAGVNVGHLADVIAEIENLVAISKGMASVDSSKMASFGLGLKALGQVGLDGFIGAFTDSKTRIEKTASDTLQVFLKTVNSKKTDFSKTAYDLMVRFTEGVSKEVKKLPKIFAETIATAVKTIRLYHVGFYNAGGYLVDGFCNGINANVYKAEAKAKAMALAAERAAKQALQIKSPSRVFYEIGDNTGMGFINALDDRAKDSYRAGQSLARQSVEGTIQAIGILSDAISNGVDTEPTIRPVLDLTDVTHGAHRLSAMLSKSHALSISADLANRSNREGAIVGSGSSLASISFTQNNYSPKALSRFEIYRNTQNLLNAQRRMVNH